jgi:hypothetical protein
VSTKLRFPFGSLPNGERDELSGEMGPWLIILLPVSMDQAGSTTYRISPQSITRFRAFRNTFNRILGEIGSLRHNVSASAPNLSALNRIDFRWTPSSGKAPGTSAHCTRLRVPAAANEDSSSSTQRHRRFISNSNKTSRDICLCPKTLFCVEFRSNDSLTSEDGATAQSGSPSNLVCWEIVQPDTKSWSVKMS